MKTASVWCVVAAGVVLTCGMALAEARERPDGPRQKRERPERPEKPEGNAVAEGLDGALGEAFRAFMKEQREARQAHMEALQQARRALLEGLRGMEPDKGLKEALQFVHRRQQEDKQFFDRQTQSLEQFAQQQGKDLKPPQSTRFAARIAEMKSRLNEHAARAMALHEKQLAALRGLEGKEDLKIRDILQALSPGERPRGDRPPAPPARKGDGEA